MKKNFFWVSGPSLGCFWIVLRFWPKIFMKNACFLPKIEIGWDLGCFGKFHKILKIWHFLIMKNFFESGFLMSHGGSFPLGVKLHKCKKVYPKCVVAQRLSLLMVWVQYVKITGVPFVSIFADFTYSCFSKYQLPPFRGIPRTFVV